MGVFEVSKGQLTVGEGTRSIVNTKAGMLGTYKLFSLLQSNKPE